MTDRRIAWYRQMLVIRLFEEKVQELFMQGLVEGGPALHRHSDTLDLRDDHLSRTRRRARARALGR